MLCVMIEFMNDSMPVSRREKQRRVTHEAILFAARSTMKSRGFKDTTIREVAAASQVAVGTVMAHFGSKEELLYEVFYGDIQRIADDIFNTLNSTQSLSEQLVYIGSSFLTSYASESELYTDFLEHSLFARGDWGERFTNQVKDVGARIAALYVAAVEHQEICEDVDIQAAVMAFFAHYYFVLIIQIKAKFSDVESGVAQLQLLINQHYKGIKNEASQTGQE